METEIERVLKGKRGLVIDDNPTILHLALKYLTLQGCEVTTVSDVPTAWDIVSEKDFDFILCDIKMPGLGGPDFYRMVTEQKSNLKDRIIFITGDALDDSAKAFIDSVTNPHVEKPFNLNQLGEVIAKALIPSR